MTDNRKSDPSESTLLAQLSEIGHSWLNDVTDRDIALGALPPDYEAQLLAIRNLLLSHRDAEEAELIRLREIEELGESQSSQRLADDWVDQLHGMVYQDAAHSMAAIGLLAPFIESLFVHFFRYIATNTTGEQRPISTHERWHQSSTDYWDCRYVWRKGRRQRDVVRGILQLSDAIGATANLPAALDTTLSALFAYRNQMFHWGLEWPINERERFTKRIQSEGWRDWFSKSESGGRPWIIYMSRDFVDHCIDMIDAIIDGIGRYCREHS